MERIKIEDIAGFYFGHAQNEDAGTGCTVIVCPEGAVCGVDVRGGSPATRDTDSLNPLCNRKTVHAVLLTGGSSFGLDAAGGIMKKLEESGIGRDVQITKVPNVCAAVLFDLKLGYVHIRPDETMGYAACEAALRKDIFQSGCFGAGTGASLGKLRGITYAMKGGIGTCAFRQGALMVGAVMAVNCIGDVWENGRILAGCRKDDGMTFADGEQILLQNYSEQKDGFSGRLQESENTVIGCIVTNARVTKVQANKLATIGHNGLARVIYPAHTTFDGDTIFCMNYGTVSANIDAVGILAAKAVQEAVWTAVKTASSMYELPAWKDLYRT